MKDEALLFRVIRAAFNQRRKTLVNALSSGLGLGKDGLERILTELGLDPRVRGETLDLRAFAAVSDKILADKVTDL